MKMPHLGDGLISSADIFIFIFILIDMKRLSFAFFDLQLLTFCFCRFLESCPVSSDFSEGP
jgi:hypothetical protein